MNGSITHKIPTKNCVNLTTKNEGAGSHNNVPKSLLRTIEHIFHFLNRICFAGYKENHYICNVFIIVYKLMKINENTRGLGKKIYTSNKKPVSEENSNVAQRKYFYDLTKTSNQIHLDYSGFSASGASGAFQKNPYPFSFRRRTKDEVLKPGFWNAPEYIYSFVNY